MGQSLSVALHSIRSEIKRFRRKRQAHEESGNEETKGILEASSGGTAVVVAFQEQDAPLVDPPYL